MARCLLVAVVTGGAPSYAHQLPADPQALARFQQELQVYVQLRQAIVVEMGPLAPDADKEHAAAFQRDFTTAVIARRKSGPRGNIFNPDMESAIRRILMREFDGPGGASLIHEIKQGNPALEGTPLKTDPTQEVKVPVPLRVNGLYPFAAPVSNVPPTLLQSLPALPSEVHYRFVGGSLILRDGVANVILDYIPDVVPTLGARR